MTQKTQISANKFSRYFLVFILTLFTFETFSQRQVSGVISDLVDGEKLPGVVISEVETDNVVVSDMDGKFLITTLKDTCTLRIAYIGYVAQTVHITQDTTLYIVLEQEEWELAFGDFGMVPQMRLARWLSIGVNYEAVNSMLGLAFSNGYDEVPFIRSTEVFSGVYFESFDTRLTYDRINTYNFFNVGLNFLIHQ